MGWGVVPVGSGDTLQAAQIMEVRGAIQERQSTINYVWSSGLSAPASIIAGDICSSADIMEYRGKIEEMIPSFVNESNQATWSLGAIMTHVFSTGRTDWIRIPARVSSTEGNIVSGDIAYIEHMNEMQEILDELRWIRIGVSVHADDNTKMGLFKSSNTGYSATRAAAIDDYWNVIASAPVTPIAYHNTVHHAGQEIYYNYASPPSGYQIPVAEWSRVFYETDYKLPEDCITSARASWTMNSLYADSGQTMAWTSYDVVITASDTITNSFGSGDWAYGNTVVTFSTPTTAFSYYSTADGDNFVTGAVNYLQARGMEVEPSDLDTAVWLVGNNYGMGFVTDIDYIYLQLNYTYK